MIRKLSIAMAAACMAFGTVPAFAQDEAEEPRTTYRIEFIKLKPGAGERWSELGEKYFGPATDEAGLKRPAVHWLMGGPWDIMMVFEMPRGMASLDTHASPERAAFRKALAKVAGGEEQAKKVWEEDEALTANSVTTFSHTHP